MIIISYNVRFMWEEITRKKKKNNNNKIGGMVFATRRPFSFEKNATSSGCLKKKKDFLGLGLGPKKKKTEWTKPEKKMGDEGGLKNLRRFYLRPTKRAPWLRRQPTGEKIWSPAKEDRICARRL